MSKNKKKPESYWNYRILTRRVEVNTVAGSWREFFIAEVHYKNGKPTGYGAKESLTSGWETIKDLKWTVKHLKEAFKKPVLDVDNWPKKWKK